MFAINSRQILLRARKIWHLNSSLKKDPNPLWITFRHKQNNSSGSTGVLLNNLFGKYLLFTNTVGSGILMVVGDIIVQEYERRTNGLIGNKNSDNNNVIHYDIKRMGRMFVAGALMGPLHHYIYDWMEKMWPIPNFKNTIRKILIDELVMAPLCIVIFFYSICFLEKRSIKETNDEIKGKFVIMYLVDWILWPPVQYFNFRYLHVKYRVTFVNICTVIYNVFMSHMKHNYQFDT